MYIAIDIGGTKTLLSVLSADGIVGEQIKFPTPEDYSEFLKMLADSVNKLTTKNFISGCVAVPGKLNRQQGIAIMFGNLPWRNVAIRDDNTNIVNCPILLENDANLAGLSEANLLKDSYTRAVYITISTGIGAAFVVNGTLEPSMIDVEPGQISTKNNNEYEIWEKFASGKAIYNTYGMRASDIEDPAIWQEVSQKLAGGFTTLIAYFAPDVIIIGGGVGSHFHKFKDQLEQDVQTILSPMLTMPVIVAAQHPEEAVIYGCYQLIKTHQDGKQLTS